MYKVSHTKVSTGIWKKAKGVYVFRIDRGSKDTVAWRHQKQAIGLTDKEAIQRFKLWLDNELEERANGSDVPTFAEYTFCGDIPADDGQFLTQLKDEATSHKSSGTYRRVTNLQTVTEMRSAISILQSYKHFSSKPINVITPEDVDQLLNELKTDRDVTNNTVNHYLHYISKAFVLAQQAGWSLRALIQQDRYQQG